MRAFVLIQIFVHNINVGTLMRSAVIFHFRIQTKCYDRVCTFIFWRYSTLEHLHEPLVLDWIVIQVLESGIVGHCHFTTKPLTLVTVIQAHLLKTTNALSLGFSTTIFESVISQYLLRPQKFWNRTFSINFQLMWDTASRTTFLNIDSFCLCTTFGS